MSAYFPYTPEFNGLTGQQIQKIADSQHPIKPAGAGIAIQGIVYTTAILCTAVFSLRVWVRFIRREQGRPIGIDDYLAVGGFGPYLPACALAIAGTYYGVGAPDDAVTPFMKIRAKELQLLYELIYFGSSTLTKFSIAFTILRICTKNRYRFALYGAMGTMALTAFGALIFLFSDCRPFATRWNPFLGKCWAPAPNGWFIMSYIGTSIQVATDWVVAITPFFIVRNLQMNQRKKISVCAILGLGVLASFAAIMRIAMYPQTDERYHPKDNLVKEAQLVIWSHLEGSFGIIACNLPPLKQLFKAYYRGSSERSGNQSAPLSTGGRGTQLGDLDAQGKSHMKAGSRNTWNRISEDDDTSSKHHIIRETEVRVETSSVDPREDRHDQWETDVKAIV
ncbi:hypothetical protein TGAM01_v206884 [Trichoderma gamsii]|uniref:Rhodopsin domain-containing protein n=2 Tax=Trichoderma gamsii TaxID=398673 RepID=A0A2P4ZIS8_9HYPO|nr:hypothetical protein TGAM01_v206884 [Trichoderma gamsii]PON24196.1 hypothetical protein TGAM01_v206884 [Trichoderma gamsii]